MMQIVIDIPKHIYEHAKEQSEDSNDEWDAMRAIANGTPLSKGHGKVIDYGYVVDAIDDWINAGEYDYTNATYYLRKRVANTPIIIEADKGESEG